MFDFRLQGNISVRVPPIHRGTLHPYSCRPGRAYQDTHFTPVHSNAEASALKASQHS